MSTFKADYIIARQEELAGNTSSIPVKTVVNGTAKAWVNFNGSGTIAIRANFNVASITDNGVGVYTVNMANALVDTNYSATFGICLNATEIIGDYSDLTARTSSTIKIRTYNIAGAAGDPIQVNVSINR